MAIKMEGRVYYRTLEVCRKVGISRATLFRGLSDGSLTEAANRDENGWRLFSEEDIERIRTESGVVNLREEL